ncbi:hypothetical protein PCE1_004749 [Barthelona sp. PCE]
MPLSPPLKMQKTGSSFGDDINNHGTLRQITSYLALNGFNSEAHSLAQSLGITTTTFDRETQFYEAFSARDWMTVYTIVTSCSFPSPQEHIKARRLILLHWFFDEINKNNFEGAFSLVQDNYVEFADVFEQNVLPHLLSMVLLTDKAAVVKYLRHNRNSCLSKANPTLHLLRNGLDSAVSDFFTNKREYSIGEEVDRHILNLVNELSGMTLFPAFGLLEGFSSGGRKDNVISQTNWANLDLELEFRTLELESKGEQWFGIWNPTGSKYCIVDTMCCITTFNYDGNSRLAYVQDDFANASLRLGNFCRWISDDLLCVTCETQDGRVSIIVIEIKDNAHATVLFDITGTVKLPQRNTESALVVTHVDERIRINSWDDKVMHSYDFDLEGNLIEEKRIDHAGFKTIYALISLTPDNERFIVAVGDPQMKCAYLKILDPNLEITREQKIFDGAWHPYHILCSKDSKNIGLSHRITNTRTVGYIFFDLDAFVSDGDLQTYMIEVKQYTDFAQYASLSNAGNIFAAPTNSNSVVVYRRDELIGEFTVKNKDGSTVDVGVVNMTAVHPEESIVFVAHDQKRIDVICSTIMPEFEVVPL